MLPFSLLRRPVLERVVAILAADSAGPYATTGPNNPTADDEPRAPKPYASPAVAAAVAYAATALPEAVAAEFILAAGSSTGGSSNGGSDSGDSGSGSVQWTELYGSASFAPAGSSSSPAAATAAAVLRAQYRASISYRAPLEAHADEVWGKGGGLQGLVQRSVAK